MQHVRRRAHNGERNGQILGENPERRGVRGKIRHGLNLRPAIRLFGR